MREQTLSGFEDGVVYEHNYFPVHNIKQAKHSSIYIF